jgi:hypothetical protein
MIDLLIALVIWGLVLAIIWWAIAQIPVPAPFSWVIRVVFALIVVLVLLSLLGVGDLPSARLRL